MTQDAGFRAMVGKLVGESAPWKTGQEFAEAFRAQLTMTPQVIEWLVATLRGYGVAVE